MKMSMKKVMFALTLCFTMLCGGTAFGMNDEEFDITAATADVQQTIAMTKPMATDTADDNVALAVIDDPMIPMAEAPEISLEPVVATPELSVALAVTAAPEQSVPAEEPAAEKSAETLMDAIDSNDTSGITNGFVWEKTETADEVIVTIEAVGSSSEPTFVMKDTETVLGEAPLPEDEYINEETSENEALTTNMTLEFTENGDILAVYGLGADNGICAEVLGKWFPDGHIAMYEPAYNPLGPAICAGGDETGNNYVCINGYTIEYTDEFENTAQPLIRFLDYLALEGLADKVFDSTLTYAVIAIPTVEDIEVDFGGYGDNLVLVGIPDRELSGADFVNLVNQLQTVLDMNNI